MRSWALDIGQAHEIGQVAAHMSAGQEVGTCSLAGGEAGGDDEVARKLEAVEVVVDNTSDQVDAQEECLPCSSCSHRET